MRSDTKKITNNLSHVLAAAITHMPSSKKLTNAIHKSAKKLAKKLIKLQSKVIETAPIIIEKIITNTNHKATNRKVVVAKAK